MTEHSASLPVKLGEAARPASRQGTGDGGARDPSVYLVTGTSRSPLRGHLLWMLLSMLGQCLCGAATVLDSDRGASAASANLTWLLEMPQSC